MKRIRKLGLLPATILVLLVSVAGNASAQRAYKVIELDPPSGGDLGVEDVFVTMIAPIGDQSSPKDGYRDFAVGDPNWDNPSASGSNHGRVIIYSGKDLSIINTITDISRICP